MMMGSKLNKVRIKYICRLMGKRVVNALEISAGSSIGNSILLIPFSPMLL